MAEIAKTAGMSPGHIDNLIENKADIVLAEASRNPKPVAVVQQSQALVNQNAQELIRESLGEQAGWLPAGEIEGRALLLGALFNGLTAPSVREPAMSQRVPAMAPVMRRVLQVMPAP